MKLFHRKSKLSKPKVVTCLGCLGAPLFVVLLIIGDFYWRNRAIQINVPTPAVPSVNARDDFLNAGKMAKKVVHTAYGNSPTPQTFTIADFKANALELEPVIAALQPGFKKIYTELPNRSLASSAAIFPVNSVCRDLARQLSSAAMYYDLIGNHARAEDLRLDAMEMGVMVVHGGTEITDLVAKAGFAMGANNFESSLASLSPADLEHIARRLNEIRSKVTDFSDVLSEEGNSAISNFVELQKSTGGIKARYDVMMDDGTGTGTVTKSPKFSELKEFARSEFSDKNLTAHEIQDYFLIVAREVRTPYHLKLVSKTPTNPVIETFNNFVFTIWSKHLGMQDELDLFRLEVALLRFKAASKKFPKTLSELAPKYLPSIPLDPFAGDKPYRYQLNPDGSYKLYGLGPDMIDHHGTPGKYAGDNGFDFVAGKLGRKPKFPKK